MKKILIAEDEYLLRLGLKSIIDWPSQGYFLVGEACNGKEALELFQRHLPDILITDIKMPLMDGIELIQATKQIKPDLQVIILSHHDDFYYAKEAITLGASRYILKSELNQTLLLEALSSLNFPSEAPNENGKQTENKNDSLSKRFADILLGSETDMQSLFEYFPGTRYYIISRECINRNIKLNETLQNNFSNMISDNPKALLCLCSRKSNSLIADCLFDASSYDNSYEALEAAQSYLKINNRNIQQYYDFHIRSGISKAGDLFSFKEMLTQAEAARKASFFQEDTIACYQPPTTENITINYTLLNSLISAHDQKRMEQYIAQLFEMLHAQRDYDQAINIAISLLSLAKSSFFQHKLENLSPELEKQFDNPDLDEIMQATQLEAYLQNAYKKLFDCFDGRSSPHYSYLINRCLIFIQSNYDQNISLSDAADALNVSKSYLSLLFKQETSINFSNYLAEYRVKKAKELFKNTDMKVYEVADATGFNNSYYFSKVFKDIVGVSCKDYKNEISRESMQKLNSFPKD